jgi:hypothetical protein
MNAKATQDEHRIIDQVVGSMAVLVEKLESGREVEQSYSPIYPNFFRPLGHVPPW